MNFRTAGPAPERLSALSALCPPAYLRARYRRIVLVSHPRHIAALDLADTESLIVSTDWLAWRQAVDRGGHCLHFEAMLADWPDERGDPGGQWLTASRWMEKDGADATVFQGLSLGCQFVGDLVLFTGAYQRLWHAIERVCLKYRPDVLVLVDLRSERNQVDDTVKRLLAGDIAKRHGIAFDDRLDAPPENDPDWPDHTYFNLEPQESGVRPLLRRIYSRAVALLFRLALPHVWRRPKVFLISNPAAVLPLLAGFGARRIAPVLLASLWPKSLGFLWHCLRRGILLVSLPEVRLDAGEEAEVARILADADAILAADGSAFGRARRHFLMALLRGRGQLRHQAREVKQYDKLFRAVGVRRVIVGDSGNALNRLMLETGRKLGAEAEEMPNGMFLSDMRVDTRIGRGDRAPTLTRFLSWGRQNEEWMAATGSKVPCVRVGYPALDALQARAGAPVSGKTPRRVLVLPIWVDAYDPIGFHSNKIAYTVALAMALKAAGIPEVRVKIHPGPPRRTAYQRALDYHGLDVQVFKEGPINPHIEWADAVVGPPNSGSMVETLAVGKPYYALRGYPSFIARGYTDRIGTFDDIDELTAALSAGRHPDGRAVLEYLCSYDSIPRATDRFWDAQEQTLVGHAPAFADDAALVPAISRKD